MKKAVKVSLVLFVGLGMTPRVAVAPKVQDRFILECIGFCSPELPSGIYKESWAKVCECRDSRVLKKVL